jgi:hypothetical protein
MQGGMFDTWNVNVNYNEFIRDQTGTDPYPYPDDLVALKKKVDNLY